MSNVKTCSNCRNEKPLDEFYGESRSHCKECERTAAKERMARKENKIRTAYKDAKRQAEKYGVYDDLTLDDLFYVYAVSNRCEYCDTKSDDLQVEHAFSLSSGGHNTVANVTLACPRCNRRKGNKPILDEVERGRMDKDSILRLIDRISYRMGTPKPVVHELLSQQQTDYRRDRDNKRRLKSCDEK